eukprot:6149106-Pleurochrysis_carterae.AAC.1
MFSGVARLHVAFAASKPAAPYAAREVRLHLKQVHNGSDMTRQIRITPVIVIDHLASTPPSIGVPLLLSPTGNVSTGSLVLNKKTRQFLPEAERRSTHGVHSLVTFGRQCTAAKAPASSDSKYEAVEGSFCASFVASNDGATHSASFSKSRALGAAVAVVTSQRRSHIRGHATRQVTAEIIIIHRRV